MSGQKTPPQLLAIIAEQADRIAWLEGDVAQWRIKLAAAEAESKRLRGALGRIIVLLEPSPKFGQRARALDVARAALDGTP